ncbi:MAG TPA: MFS transporter, partial [Pirellulales bacterium]|nr:MFS transporter [Pirellulales bacterium]
MATEPVGGRARLSFKAIGRALAHRNYRLFFAGQGTSLIGTWMTRVAAGVFVKMLRPDVNWLLGVVAFAGLFPAFLLGPIAGVLVDRWDRRRCLVVTQVLSLIQSAWMAWIAFSALSVDAKIWQIIALSVC